jgi:uncharacterized membrane protein
MDPETDSIYRTPESQLETHVAVEGEWGSVERALSGEAEFGIEATIREAWDLVPGSKGVLWGIVLLGGIGNLVVEGVIAGVVASPDSVEEPTMALVAQVFVTWFGLIFVAPITAGGQYYAIKRAANDSDASFGVLGETFSVFVPIAVATATMLALLLIGFVLLILPFVYLVVAYSFTIPLIVDKKMGVWEAMETSRKGVTQCWFRLFGLFMVTGLIGALGTLVTFGIGLIWLVPMFSLVSAVAYRDLFGYDGAAA